MPYQHKYMFTNSSLATLFHLNGFVLSCAWFFGNDALDRILKIPHQLNANPRELIDDCFTALKKCFDCFLASDIMVIGSHFEG
jgi:hypothetical protein